MALFICTDIIRNDFEGVPGECAVVIHFNLTSFHPGCPATWDDPADPAEYEFEFVRAEFDGDHSDFPGDLTPEEIASLEARLMGDLFEDACEAANYELGDRDDGPDPDDLRDRAIEDRMMAYEEPF